MAHPETPGAGLPPPPPPPPPQVGSRTDGRAIASLVLGVAGLIICPVICSVLAIVFGTQAKREIDRNPAVEGRGMAQAGFVLGIVGLVLTAIVAIIYIAVIAAATSS